MKILISAAEASSDVHGANLLRALRKLDPSVDAFGIGGPNLREAGLRQEVDAGSLLAMGFSEILGRLPKIFSALRRMADTAKREKPDVAILMDYPDFHFRLAKRLGEQGIPLVYYIPPKIWVWRRHRVKFLKRWFARVLCIFPFEESFYRDAGVPVTYVGNPVVDELPMDLTRGAARKTLGLSSEDLVLTLLPGSRPAELKRHLVMMLEAAESVALRLKRDPSAPLKILIPLPRTANLDGVRSQVEAWLRDEAKKVIKPVVSQGDAPICLKAADAALVKSGTSTLEAALLECPLAVVYRPSPLTAWIFKHVINYHGPVGLVNLALGWKTGMPYIAREILCEEATAANLAEEAFLLLSDPVRREEMKKKLKALRDGLVGSAGPRGPSESAAAQIFALVKGRQP